MAGRYPRRSLPRTEGWCLPSPLADAMRIMLANASALSNASLPPAAPPDWPPDGSVDGWVDGSPCAHSLQRTHVLLEQLVWASAVGTSVLTLLVLLLALQISRMQTLMHSVRSECGVSNGSSRDGLLKTTVHAPGTSRFCLKKKRTVTRTDPEDTAVSAPRDVDEVPTASNRMRACSLHARRACTGSFRRISEPRWRLHGARRLADRPPMPVLLLPPRRPRRAPRGVQQLFEEALSE